MSYLVDVKMTKKNDRFFRHFYTTKIHILFKTTTLFLKKNLISISFLINQIAI